MGIKVAKFGGSSLADAEQFRKVRGIIQDDPQRRYIIPSAPGKNKNHRHKITDLLYLCRRHVEESLPFGEIFDHITDRYRGLISELSLDLDLSEKFEEIRMRISGGASADYAASRGEYLTGRILSAFLDYDFLDPSEIILFNAEGRLDNEKTRDTIAARLRWLKYAVIPGFYGATPEGEVKTFSRGGSDVTGALIAQGVGAEVYENWTDITGLRMADPRIVPQAKRIETLTYRELRELSYTGATILHDEAVFPAREAGIPVHVRNTNQPDEPGTLIVTEAPVGDSNGGISGIAGRKDFTVIAMEKALMNREVGFGRKVLEVLCRHDISYEHTPTGIDSFSVVLSDSELGDRLPRVLDDLRKECSPEKIEVYPDMALVAVVGRGMAHRPGVAAKVFTALAQERINVRMIDQGSSEINIILGVETKDFEESIRAVYKAFVN